MHTDTHRASTIDFAAARVHLISVLTREKVTKIFIFSNQFSTVEKFNQYEYEVRDCEVNEPFLVVFFF